MSGSRAEARQAFERAMALGAKGQLDEALQAFDAAHQLDGSRPEYPYQLAFTHVLLGNFPAALEAYERTREVVGGDDYFTLGRAIFALRGERDGRFHAGSWRVYLAVEGLTQGEQQLALARSLTERSPTFAAGWLIRSRIEPDEAEQRRCLERAVETEADVSTLAHARFNLAGLIDGEAARGLYRQVAHMDGAPEHLRTFARINAGAVS